MEDRAMIYGLLLFGLFSFLAYKKQLKKCTVFIFVLGFIQWFYNKCLDVLTFSAYMSFFGIIWESGIIKSRLINRLK